MKARQSVCICITMAAMGLFSGIAAGGDTNVIIQRENGVASDINSANDLNKIKDFDFKLQQRDRDRMKQWNIEDSMGAIKVGDTYFNRGEIEDAISFYQIAIKIDPSNPAAHEKYIHARGLEKQSATPHYHRAMEYYRKGLREKAIDELVLEIKEHPDNETARMKLNEIEGE